MTRKHWANEYHHKHDAVYKRHHKMNQCVHIKHGWILWKLTTGQHTGAQILHVSMPTLQSDGLNSELKGNTIQEEVKRIFKIGSFVCDNSD